MNQKTSPKSSQKTNPNSNELYHYGIKGMKWGIRRTEAQLARARGQRPSSESASKNTSATAKAKSSTPARKKVSEMSDDELRQAVQRLQFEQQYRKLNPEKVSAGKKFATKVMNDVVVPAVTEVARNTLRNALTSAVESAISKEKKK